MTLKQFLKPDWRKIVLEILMFLILLVYISPCFDECCLESPLLNCPCLNCPFYACFSPMLDIEYVFKVPFFNFLPIFLVVMIIVLYILSCLMVWIYDKVKKK